MIDLAQIEQCEIFNSIKSWNTLHCAVLNKSDKRALIVYSLYSKLSQLAKSLHYESGTKL